MGRARWVGMDRDERGWGEWMWHDRVDEGCTWSWCTYCSSMYIYPCSVIGDHFRYNDILWVLTTWRKPGNLDKKRTRTYLWERYSSRRQGYQMAAFSFTAALFHVRPCHVPDGQMEQFRVFKEFVLGLKPSLWWIQGGAQGARLVAILRRSPEGLPSVDGWVDRDLALYKAKVVTSRLVWCERSAIPVHIPDRHPLDP